MFNPFAAAQGASSSQPPMPEPASHKPEGGPPAEPKAEPRNDLDEMKRQLDELQKKIEGMIPKG
jgi:polyhydroxyalkanoate synthesis regulator protein